MTSHQAHRRRPANTSEEHDDARKPSTHHTQQRRSQAISLNAFSTKRGHDRAIAEFKKRKETKFRKNATLLREYSKAMKSEGYDVGRGASRKRDRDGGVADRDDDEPRNKPHEADIESNKRQKRHKSDPLKAAREKAQQLKNTQLELENQKKQRQHNEEKKVQNRKKRARKMMERTRKGQPLMKNVIGDLLGKIKSEVDAEGNDGH
jgi:hypothetical protein